MTRNEFLKTGALLFLTPLLPGAAQAAPEIDPIFQRLRITNDQQVTRLLKTPPSTANRQTGYDFAMLAAAWSSPGAQYYHDVALIPAMEQRLRILNAAQSPDGTLNFANLESPPDTAFLVDPLAAGALLLQKDAALKTINSDLKAFLLRTGEALTYGGVHTPNHRWVICAALARLHLLYPDKRYTDRIEDWLGEGIYMDADGHFPERSGNYSIVEDNSLLTMGRLLNRPSLFEAVKKNLDLTWYYMDPDGTLVATDSRRQDQYKMKKSMAAHYLHYRYFAIRDNNALFAGIARVIEQLKGFDEEIMDTAFYQFCENTLLQQALPAGTAPPTDYERFFPSSSVLRIRRSSTTTTLFGGVDWPLVISSGRSDSPDLYTFRKGRALLKHLRLSTNFFDTGYFYSEGISKNDNSYTLYKKLEVPYYQPLPKPLRNPQGDYLLSPSQDRRFWNKMDYANRPVSNVKTLETTVTFREKNNELTFSVTGQAGVQVTIELCFEEGGQLSGVSPAVGGNFPTPPATNFLEKGTGEYTSGGSTIRFGPGTAAHHNITGLEGERYSSHFGTLRSEGLFVYLTGVTPFHHTLLIS